MPGWESYSTWGRDEPLAGPLFEARLSSDDANATTRDLTSLSRRCNPGTRAGGLFACQMFICRCWGSPQQVSF